MTFAELVVLSIALAMDAVAVSLARGMAMRRPHWPDALLLAFAFGLFQALMPLLGWLLSSWFAGAVEAVAPWIAFVLLALIGGKMIADFLADEDDEPDVPAAGSGGGVAARTGLLRTVTLTQVATLAVATSIDAFAVGVTFGVLEVSVAPAVTLIGVVTFALSLVAVLVGARVGQALGRWATLAGGVVLVLIGLRILLDHLGVL